MPYTTDPDTGAQVPGGTSVPASSRANIRDTLANQEARLDTLEAGIDDIPIGAATPSTGAFTSLTVSGTLTFGDDESSIGHSASGMTIYSNASIEGALDITNAISGSAVTPIVDADITWDTSGNPTAILLNVTNTSSGSSSKLVNLLVDSVSKFSVSKAGNVIAAGSIEAGLPIKVPYYPITLPSAITYPYSIAYFGSASGGKYLVFSDGTQWRYPDGTLV